MWTLKRLAQFNRLWLTLCLGLCLAVSTKAQIVPAKGKVSEKSTVWMQVEVTVVPISENTKRSAIILGFARKGQVLAVEKIADNWVKVRVNDTLEGWVPATAVSESGPPVNYNPELVKGILLFFSGITIGGFFLLAVSLTRKRKAESQERARQAISDVKRRLQNKIQVLFRVEPKIHSHLSMDEIDLLEYLRGIGYVANLENDSEKFLSSCKAFKPNLIIAAFDLQSKVEEAMETDAMLINTPVVYLHCDNASATPENSIRTYLETNATDQELVEAITLTLKKSPEKIRFSVKPTALKGGIHVATLMELLHFLSAVKKNGQLIVTSKTQKGEIFFHNGEIVKAEIKGLKGEKAVLCILDLNSGTFEFHEKTTVVSIESTISTVKILMDWAKTRDENNHNPRT